MEDKDIYRLFLNVVQSSSQITGDNREVFSILIKTTLKYRDDILESKGIVVTVEDVRTVLGWLVPSITTGLLPKTDNRIRLDLLKLWLDELRLLGRPEISLH